MEIIKISPESLEVANSYLTTGNVIETANELGIAPDLVTEVLGKREVRTYVDQVFLDTGYRNRNKIGSALDKIIESKLEEAEETGLYSSKDLADLLDMAHKHRMAELKLQQVEAPKQQTNVQINENPFGQGKYGELIQKLMECPNE